MNRRKIVALVLSVAAIGALSLGGCNKADSTPDETEISSSQLSTTVATATTVPATTKVAETETKTEAETNAEIQNVFDNSNESVESNEPQLCTVYVDEKAYTANVGDTVNYVFYLKTPEALEDFQAVTNYDSSMLELLETDLEQMFPVAGSAVVCNTDMPNVIKYNAVNINGMDFTDGGTMISLKFEVLDSGSVAIGTTLEYMDSVKSEPYVSDYKIVGDITYSEKII